MKGLDFLDAVGQIDESYILELDENSTVQKNLEQKNVVKWNYKRILPYVASFLLLCTVSLSGYEYWVHMTGNSVGIGDMANMRLGVVDETTDEPTVIEETGDVEEPARTMEAFSDEDLVADDSAVIEDDNTSGEFFENIFENVVSFFENLRF